MTDKTLSKARGLNSIADPSDFKGSRGRKGRGKTNEDTHVEPESPPEARQLPPAHTHDVPVEPADSPQASPSEALPPASVENGELETTRRTTSPGAARRSSSARKRRELSVPLPVAQAVEATGINPADVVMAAYRTHGDAVYAGTGGRMMARGRQRLRLSISDGDFEKLTRLGDARGWNRSETVTVLLTMELLSQDKPVS